MSKKRKLHALRKKVALDQVESEITERLTVTDNDASNGGYLSNYDASLLNKAIVSTPKEESVDE